MTNFIFTNHFIKRFRERIDPKEKIIAYNEQVSYHLQPKEVKEFFHQLLKNSDVNNSLLNDTAWLVQFYEKYGFDAQFKFIDNEKYNMRCVTMKRPDDKYSVVTVYSPKKRILSHQKKIMTKEDKEQLRINNFLNDNKISNLVNSYIEIEQEYQKFQDIQKEKLKLKKSEKQKENELEILLYEKKFYFSDLYLNSVPSIPNFSLLAKDNKNQTLCLLEENKNLLLYGYDKSLSKHELLFSSSYSSEIHKIFDELSLKLCENSLENKSVKMAFSRLKQKTKSGLCCIQNNSLKEFTEKNPFNQNILTTFSDNYKWFFTIKNGQALLLNQVIEFAYLQFRNEKINFENIDFKTKENIVSLAASEKIEEYQRIFDLNNFMNIFPQINHDMHFKNNDIMIDYQLKINFEKNEMLIIDSEGNIKYCESINQQQALDFAKVHHMLYDFVENISIKEKVFVFTDNDNIPYACYINKKYNHMAINMNGILNVYLNTLKEKSNTNIQMKNPGK